MTGAWVVLAALGLAILFGGYRWFTDGRVRTVPVPASPLLAAVAGEQTLGARATFVQFSSEVCAPCRSTARVLAEVTKTTPGVAHVELDAAERLELVAELGITRTPTVFLLDEVGNVRHRVVGAVRKPDILTALAGLTGSGGKLQGEGNR